MGSLYNDQGRLDDAEKMCKQALEGYRKIQGPEGISTYQPALKAVLILAMIYQKQGRGEEAMARWREALQGYEMVFGENDARYQELRGMVAQREWIEQLGPERRQRVLEELGWKRPS